MERLRSADYTRILAFLTRLYSVRDLDEFGTVLVNNIRQLIRCEVASYDEMDPERHSSVDRTGPDGIMTPEIMRNCWAPVMHEHPVLIHCQQTGDLNAHRVSDFYSQQKFHNLALYHEFYRKLSIEEGLCKGIRVSGPVVIGIGLHRARRNFSDRDVLIFNLIGPHLTQAWRNAREMTRVHHQVQEMRHVMNRFDCGVIALEPDGRARAIAPWARRALQEFCGADSVRNDVLPDCVRQWVRACSEQFRPDHVPLPIVPLVIERADSRLLIRLVSSPLQRLLFLSVQRKPSAQCASLTPRETEVLSWVAEGKTNEEIGAILTLSPRTVQKHLEHIFSKLGVETRTAAAAVLVATRPRSPSSLSRNDHENSATLLPQAPSRALES